MTIAASGRKDPELAARMASPEPKKSDVGYYVGASGLKFGNQRLAPGDEIPEARFFPRLEAWIRTGKIVEGPPNELEPESWTVAPPDEPAFRSGFPNQDAEDTARDILEPLRVGETDDDVR